jgi:hypothetical protein
MFESTLATTEDANLILKLYELRTETGLRQARNWMVGQFLPATVDEFFAVANGVGEHNAWFRQVTSYWEMASAFVLHGALNAELFVDCNSEPFYLYAKFLPLLPAIRQQMPNFLGKVGQVVEHSPVAAAKVEMMGKRLAARRAAVAATASKS